MAIKILQSDGLRWINIDQFDEVALRFLRQNFKFHPLDLRDCSRANPHPKISTYPNYLFIVFQFPELIHQEKQIVNHEVDIFLGENFLITVQNKRFKALKNCFYRCARNEHIKKKYFGSTTGFLFYKIIDELFNGVFTITEFIKTSTSQLEDHLHKKEVFEFVDEASSLRRNILNFRSIIEPQRYIFRTLLHTRRDFLPADLSIYFNDLHDRLEEMWVIMNNYNDIVGGISESYETLLRHRTNQIIKVLTYISIFLMPLTLLSGIYGMNIVGLPWAQRPENILLIFVVLTLFIFLVVSYLRRKYRT